MVQANAASGMAVDDDCKRKFLELKAKRTYRFVVFRIDEKQKQVVVERLGEPNLTYDDFAATLPTDECRYCIYDFDFVTEEGCQKSKIFFIAWYAALFRVQIAAPVSLQLTNHGAVFFCRCDVKVPGHGKD